MKYARYTINRWNVIGRSLQCESDCRMSYLEDGCVDPK